jgi:hypothetical protein
MGNNANRPLWVELCLRIIGTGSVGRFFLEGAPASAKNDVPTLTPNP